MRTILLKILTQIIVKYDEMRLFQSLLSLDSLYFLLIVVWCSLRIRASLKALEREWILKQQV